MKVFSIIGAVLFLLTGFSSCTIEKRHYRNGFYVDWNSHSSESAHVTSLNRTERRSDTTTQNHVGTETNPVVTTGDPGEENSVVSTKETSADVPHVAKQEGRINVPDASETTKHPAPLIEKDRKQAMGAGIAAAIFFILGMLGLIIKGVGGPVGIFIVTAFVCFFMCVLLASFLYPRDPVVKQPKEADAPIDNMAKIGIGFAVMMVAIVLAIIVVFLSAFGWLFF